jgi:hypothetical protein
MDMEGMAKAYLKTEKDLRNLVIMTDTPTKIQIKFIETHAGSHVLTHCGPVTQICIFGVFALQL